MTDTGRARGLRRMAALVALLVGGLSLSAAPAPAARSAGTTETRALWVLHASFATPPQIDRLVEDAAGAGLNTLFLQVRSRGDAYFAGSPEPVGGGVAAGFDPLSHAIGRARRAGLLVRTHPEWLMVPRDLAPALLKLEPRRSEYVGRLAWWARERPQSVEGLYVSPISPDAAKYLEQIVGGLAERYPLDGVHFDYIRYPSAAFDYSRYSLAAFRAAVAPGLEPGERQRLDARAAGDPLVYTRRFPERWTDFRRLRLTDFVARLRSAVKRARPDALVSAAIVPDPREAIEGRLQDWPDWGRRGLVDVVCPIIGTPATRRAMLSSIGRLAFPPPPSAASRTASAPDPR